MGERKLLSIIVPTYNSTDYINRLIDNLNKVSVPTVEIIYCDDGSNDTTTDLILSRARNSKIVKLQHNGVSNARNVGISESKGTYITFVDSDDLIRISEFKKVVNILGKYDCDFINVSKDITEKHNMQIYQKKEIPFLVKALMGISNTFNENEIIRAPWSKFYKREFLLKNKINFYKDIQNGEDLLFNYDVLQNANTILMVKNDFYIYKIHKHSLSYVIPSHSIIDQNKKIFEHLSFSQNLMNEYELDYLKVKILITDFVRYYRYQKKFTYVKEEKRYINEIKEVMRKKGVRVILKDNLPKKLYFFVLLVSYTPFWFSNFIVHSKVMSLRRNISSL